MSHLVRNAGVADHDAQPVDLGVEPGNDEDRLRKGEQAMEQLAAFLRPVIAARRADPQALPAVGAASPRPDGAEPDLRYNPNSVSRSLTRLHLTFRES